MTRSYTTKVIDNSSRKRTDTTTTMDHTNLRRDREAPATNSTENPETIMEDNNQTTTQP